MNNNKQVFVIIPLMLTVLALVGGGQVAHARLIHPDFTSSVDCPAPWSWYDDVCEHSALVGTSGPGQCNNDTKEGESCESGIGTTDH